jgi:undecaprenyl diphosphate synthase
MDSEKNVDTPKTPKHVAIIMDGNGRWAQQRGLPRIEGHRAGTDNLRRVLEACRDLEIKYLTLYAFSTENWGRPAEEVAGLMGIIEEMIDTEIEELHEAGVRLQHFGSLEQLNPQIRDKVLSAVNHTKANDSLFLNICFNYGGRDEVIHAIKGIITDGIPAAEVTDELVSSYLYTAGVPDPDLVIRTSGELRISNFLIWQAAYAEWYFPPVFWPDFDKEELKKAVEEFGQRDRRYGLVLTEA